MVITSNTLAAAITGSGSNHHGAPPFAPDWARPPKNGQHLEGLSRSYIYRLIESGSVKSMSLTTPGAKKGVRLISVSSLRQWLAAQAAAQETAAS
jgi:predicted DNA-binding transcriptional regulator AlpA